MEKYFTIRNGRANLASTKNFSTLHIGCITPYLGTKDNVPRGYLLADGASYKTTDYPELFDIIGYTYGGSDDTFNVPNLCDGRFLEGSDTSGEYVEAGLPNITGELVSLNAGTNNFKSTEFVNGAFSPQAKWNTINGSGNMDSYGEVSFDASKSNEIYGASDTVQPKSLRVLYIVKAFHTNEGVDSKNEVSDPIIEYVEGEVATKQENIFKKHITSRKGDASDTKPYCLIATLKTSNLTFVNEPIIIEGVMGNATSSTQKMLFKASFDFRNGAKETAKVIYGYVNQSSLFSHIDLITTFDESAEIAYIYVHHKTNYSIIDADISVPQRNAELYLTIPETFARTDTIIGTEAHRMSTSTNVKVLAGLDDTTSSTTSTYSSAKIDEKYGAYTFGTADTTQWLKLTLGNSSKFQPIIITDQYGGKVEITGMADDGTYKSVKLIRYSYGDWNTYSATDYTFTSQNDANYKIRRLYYYPTNGCYYLEIRQWCTIKVSGATTKPEMVTSLPAEASEMTSIPESKYASINNSVTNSTSTWSSSKIASEINPTIDISKVFSNGALNIATLCSTYGNGRYVIVGQGTAGNGSATIDIWTLASHAISYIVNVTYSNKTSNTFIGLTYENPTVNFETNYLSACNHIAKVCTLA